MSSRAIAELTESERERRGLTDGESSSNNPGREGLSEEKLKERRERIAEKKSKLRSIMRISVRS